MAATVVLLLALAAPSAFAANNFLATFDNAYLKTETLTGSGLGVDVLNVPPNNTAKIGGEVNLATGAFSGGGFDSELVAPAFGETKVTFDFDETEPITGIADPATGEIVTNPSTYRAKVVIDYTPGPGDEDHCLLGDEPGGADTPDLVLAFSTEADYPSPYKGQRFTVDLPHLATQAVNDGALVTTWQALPAIVHTSGPGNCALLETFLKGPGALWMADGLTVPTGTTAPKKETPGAGPTTTPPPPTPIYGQTVIAEPVSGTVLVRPVGSHAFAPLEHAETLVLGSSLDTAHGRVRLTSAKTRDGQTETAELYGGRFQVRQPLKGKPLTDFTLEGFNRSGCSGKRGRAAAAPVASRLWASGAGGFHSTGKHGGAIVFGGAAWLTEERCSGTYFKVKSGAATIQDFTRGKEVKLAAGHHYLAHTRLRRKK